MFFSVPKSFNEVIKPLILLNCHSGVGVIRQPNQSNREYFCMKLHIGIIGIANWIAMCVALTVIAQAPNFRDASPMAIIMYNVLVYANCCFNVIGPCTVWLSRKGLRKCLQQMSIMDEIFESTLGAKNEYRKDYIYIICQVITVVFVVVVISGVDAAWTSAYSRSSFTYVCITFAVHRPIFIMFVMDINFYTCARYLRKKFRDLNNTLLRLAEMPTDPVSKLHESLSKASQNQERKTTQRSTSENTRAKSLRNDSHRLLLEIQKAHLELCKLTREVNSTFGIQNLISSGISFGIITGLLYTIYSAFGWQRVTDNALVEIIPSTIWTAFYVSKILMVNHICWSVGSEAQRTREVIYEFLKMNLADELQNDQIQLFAQQIFQNPIRFDACGFFILDYTFVQGIIGSITTYLIILIQMSHLSDKTVGPFIPLKNSTY